MNEVTKEKVSTSKLFVVDPREVECPLFRLRDSSLSPRPVIPLSAPAFLNSVYNEGISSLN